MHKNLDNLSENQIKDLMARYYAGETIKKLLNEFELDVRVSALYTLFPPEEYENYICEYCDSVLVADRRSKDLQKSPRYERDLYSLFVGTSHTTHFLANANTAIRLDKNLENINLTLLILHIQRQKQGKISKIFLLRTKFFLALFVEHYLKRIYMK